ncbi:unnamed protein product, partial [marine sediment metagenome]
VGSSTGILTVSGDVDMSMNQILTIADATDNSGVPSWGQVQQAISDNSQWDLSGSDIYNNNSGNVGIGTSSPSEALEVSGNIVLWGDLSMNGGQITFIGDANDPSGVPSWGQVKQAIIDGSGGSGGSTHWDLSGSNIYNNNSGNVGIGTTSPAVKLDVSGSVNITENLLEATSTGNDFTASGVTDYNSYFRQTNIIDTMKIPFITYFNGFWKPMVERCNNILSPGAGYWGQGLASPFGPNLIPIAKINMNDSYYPGNVPA